MSEKIFYFVDYENVHEAGLAGMNTLPKDCEVHLFYSQNANRLNLDLLRFVKAKVRVHKVKPGKQSLDMQMVSYLGYCIGDEDKEGTFVLVSKDTDYANTVLFWQEEGVEVRVQPAILEEKNADGMERALRSVKVTRRGRRGGKKNSAAAVQEKAPEEMKAEPAVKEAAAETKAPEPVKEEVKPAAPAAAPKEAPAEEAKAEEPVKEERAKSSRGGRRRGRPRKEEPAAAKEATEKIPETVKEEAAALREEAPKKAEKAEEKAPAVRNTKLPDEPAKVTVTVHDVPMVTHAVAQPKPERSQAVSRVQAVLAEKKADQAVARKVASIVQKHEGKKNSRQAIYLEIRKTFGQKMGVDLYNSVKGLLK